jgi:hypothetical protein
VEESKDENGLRFADDIVKGAYIPDFSPYEALEKERLAKFNKERSCPDWDKDFPYHKLDHVFEGVTLKHIILHKCTYANGSSMAEEIYNHQDASDLIFDPPVCPNLPEYFADAKMTCPSPQDFEEIPLAHKEYQVSYVARPKNPGVFTPKEMHFQDNITCYWVSPRMLI